MRILSILIILIALVIQGYAQIHPIVIHVNNRVASLEMTSTEYNNWKNNDEYNNQAIREALFQDIYQYFEDDFDFIFLILNEDTRPSNLSFGQLIQVSNDISGIGLSMFDNSSNYGSAGKLKAVIHLPQRDFLCVGPSLHELMHNWGNFGIPTEAVVAPGTGLSSFSYIPHWGFTGGSSKGQLGGFDQSTLVDNGGNSYTVESFGPNANGGNSIPYNEIELYLMGMTPISSVSNFDVFSDITSLTINTNTFDFTANTKTTYTPASLETLLGVRSPSSTTSQKNFNALVIVLTDTPLTTPQWDLVDNHAEKFSRTSSDFSSSYNFWEATNGLGTIEMNNLQNSVLPIELTYFDAKAVDNVVVLNWETANEINNDFFTIEKSKEGVNWEVVSEIKGTGTELSVSRYSYTDDNPIEGISYYRLKQTDFDKRFTYSSIKAVNLKELSSNNEILIYPNPTGNEVSIEVQAKRVGGIKMITIYNVYGKELMKIETDVGANLHKLDVSAYLNGVYILEMETINNRLITKMMIKN